MEGIEGFSPHQKNELRYLKNNGVSDFEALAKVKEASSEHTGTRRAGIVVDGMPPQAPRGFLA